MTLEVHLFCGGGHLISSSNDYLAFLRHLLQILSEPFAFLEASFHTLTLRKSPS